MNESDHLVQLDSRPNEIEASILVAALKERGVEAVATGGFTAGFFAEAPGWVGVMVDQKDLAHAKELLAEIKQELDEEVDWSQVDVGEPEDE